MNITPLMQYLPTDDPVKATIIMFGAILVVMTVSTFTVVPLIEKLVGLPIDWVKRGRPVLSTEKYDGPDVEFINSL